MATFLENKEWTHLFWIDSDIGFSPDSFYRLLLADKDVVAGIYPLKRENWPEEGVPAGTTQADFERMYTSYTINTNDKDENGEIVLKVDEDGFMKVHDAPTGFMVIKRSVFEKMMAAYPELNYISDSDYSPENKSLHYASSTAWLILKANATCPKTTLSATFGVKSAAKCTSTHNPT